MLSLILATLASPSCDADIATERTREPRFWKISATFPEIKLLSLTVFTALVAVRDAQREAEPLRTPAEMRDRVSMKGD